MSNTGTPFTPAIALSTSHNVSSSSTTSTVSSALSITHDVAGLVPLVGPQIQSVCALALRLVNGLQSLKDMQDDERKLMEKVQDTLRIVTETRGDDKAVPMPELRDELLRVESSLLSIEIYLDSRIKRSFRQRLTTLITQRDTRNATQCRDRLDSALQRFQLVCLIKMRLELDAKMTELKYDVIGSIKSLGDAVMGFLRPPPYPTRDGEKHDAFRRSIAPFHDGHVRLRDASEDEEGEANNPSKKVRTSRGSSREAENHWESGDSKDGFTSDSGSYTGPHPPNFAHTERIILPLPRKRRRSIEN